PANSAFVSVEELRLVRYISAELMELLRPFLVVLPPGEGNLNINTLPGKLLATISAQEQLQPLTDMEVALLVQDWSGTGFYNSVQEFSDSSAWQSIGIDPNTQGLAVTTNYFLVNTQVSLVQQRRSMESLLRRSADTLEVVRRSDAY